MWVNRRRARVVAFALFVLAFVGPWDRVHWSHGPTTLVYFPEIIEDGLRPLGWVILAGLVAVPLACVATILGSPSRARVIAYRVLVGVHAALFGFVTVAAPLGELIELWGPGLYALGLVVALAGEVAPLPAMPKGDYAEVFR